MTPWRGPLARIGRWSPAGRDLAAAGLLAILSLARTPKVIDIHHGTLSTGALVGMQSLAMLDCATVAVRRRSPLLALGIATLVPLVAVLMPGRLTFIGLGLPVCAYTVARLLPRDVALVAVVAAALVHGVGGIAAVAAGGDTAGVATFWGVAPAERTDLLIATAASILLPALLGSYVQTREAYTREVNARLARLAREREEKARRAVRDERGRIAGELHDIAAHDLSAIVVQAGAADRLVERDPEAVRELLQRIRAQGRDTLTALRGLVGIVRERAERDGDAAGVDGRSPQPSLKRLSGLVQHARGAGMRVDVTVAGTPHALAPAADLAAYRVLQEALANARQHAPGTPVDLSLGYEPGWLQIAVRNPRPADVAPRSGGGHGLLVMSERVSRAGGDVAAGPSEDGGWRVDARLPTAEPRR